MNINLAQHAMVKVPARDWKVEINTGDSATPAWTPVEGLTTLGFSAEMGERDTTDFDSGGWLEHVVSNRGRGLNLEGYYQEDDTGARPEGQEAVDALGEKIGAASIGEFRLTSPNGKGIEFKASSNPIEQGGGNDDNTSWGAELKVSGKPTPVTGA